ncbi:type II toxin-antitoxin system Rv0910 family toxin [Nocardioides stalactiti]|uniref:type II toxin-antitoxin system Rv0910 family toxin n=1 Tax=Nocardioides stalactiti TaxID=2755356 RepID=UPI0016030EEF|nr:SRPBCC family protein [Nocardioides stalactiti]
MGQINCNRTLPASTDAIWKIIGDVHAWDSWLSIHAGWLEEPPATLTEGSRLVQKVVMLGMANKLEWTVETVEPEKLLVITGKGMAGVKSRFSFGIAPSSDGGTDVNIEAQFEGSMVVGALAKAVEKDAAKNLNDSLDKLALAAA